MRVSKVCGEGGQTLLDIDTRAIPGQECPDREGVPQIMQAGTVAIGGTTQANLAGQRDEGLAHTPDSQWGAAFGEKEPWCGRCGPPLITAARILVQGVSR